MIRATTLGHAGRIDEALAAIEEAETTLPRGDPTGSDIGLVHAHLLLQASPPDIDAATLVLERVEELAGAHGGRMAQLQALTQLALIRHNTPRDQDSLRALRDVYETF